MLRGHLVRLRLKSSTNKLTQTTAHHETSKQPGTWYIRVRVYLLSVVDGIPDGARYLEELPGDGDGLEADVVEGAHPAVEQQRRRARAGSGGGGCEGVRTRLCVCAAAE